MARGFRYNLYERRLAFEPLEARNLLEGANFVHPGILNTATDFTRMATKVAANAEPWLDGYNKLLSSGWAHLGMNPGPIATVTRSSALNNSYTMWSQIDQTFNSAMIWKVTGDTRYADQAVSFLNAWATTNTTVNGDSNVALALGLYGFQWANVAEIMRTYSGWAAADQTKFQNYLLNVFVPGIDNYLGLPPYTQHWGSDPTHYWANWDLCNIGALMGIGVFCDRHDLYDAALNYLYTGVGNGALDKVIYYMQPGNLGQGQEAGRDQGHASLDFATLGQICQMAWNQGDDLFSYKNNEILAGLEYLAKYALGNNVPFTMYASNTGGVETQVAGPQGLYRPIFELFYNHYVIMEGLSAPYTTEALMQVTRPEGDWGNGDEYAWGTLLFALDPSTTVQPPQSLVAHVKAGSVELDWWGGANDTSFNLYRSTSASGPFTQIASGLSINSTTYTDRNVSAGTYYYKVTGVSGATETAATNVATAITSTTLIDQFKFDESGGTTASDSVGSLTGTLNGGASFVAGKSGNAVSLDGTSGYVSLPSGAISNLADYTITTWVYLNGTPATWARIFDFGDSRGDWMFLTPKSGTGALEFATGTTYNYNKEVVDAAALPNNQWVHVAVTFSNRLATLYVNGVAVASNANMDFLPYEINGGMPNSWIGRSQYTSDPYLNGKVDDFRIYSGAMTAGQVYTLATGNAAPAVPAAPLTLTAAAIPGNQVNLSWSAVSGASSYSVYRSTASGGPFWPIATVIAGTSYSDTGVAADVASGTLYYYYVAATNNGGESAPSPQASAIALPPLPGAPTGLTGKSPTSSSVLLTWTAGSDNVTYTVKRGATAGGPYSTLSTGITAATYTDNTVNAGTTYYYVVLSSNAAGAGAISAEAAVPVSDRLVRLKMDDGVGSLALDSSGNGLNATLVNSPTWTTGKYNGAVQLASASSQYLTLPTGVMNGITSFTISAWVKLTTSSTWMRVFDFGTGTSNYMFLTVHNGSNVPRFAFLVSGNSTEQVINGTSAIPTGVWTQLAVTWSNNVGILYVNGVEVGRNSNMTWNPSLLGMTTQNYLGKSQWNDPYLNGALDDFRIYTRALSASEVSALYNATVPSAPATLTTTAGAGQVTLNWSAVSGATSYNVLRSSTSGGPYMLLDSNIAGTSYVDNDLVGSGATTYYYVVTATNGTGDSGNSPQAAATPTAVSDNWSTADIGSVGIAGSSSHAGNVFSINGSGADIWGTADAFRYTYRTLIGDGTIVARVSSINATDPWAKTGLMMRESLATGGKNVYVAVTIGNGVTSQNRSSTGGSSANSAVSGITAPYWLKLTRSGGTFTTYSSADGIIWTQRSTVTISMATTIYVGLAVTAHNSTLTNASTLDHVFITPSSPTSLAAIGAPGAINLSWTPSLDAQSYNIKRSTTSGGPYTTIATGVLASSYNDATVSGTDPYFYVVTAVNPSGESVTSNEGTASALLLLGDLNGDDHRDAADIVAMMSALTNLSGYQTSRGLSAADLNAVADINGDQHVNNADLQALLNLLISGGGSTSAEGGASAENAAPAENVTSVVFGDVSSDTQPLLTSDAGGAEIASAPATSTISSSQGGTIAVELSKTLASTPLGPLSSRQTSGDLRADEWAGRRTATTTSVPAGDFAFSPIPVILEPSRMKRNFHAKTFAAHAGFDGVDDLMADWENSRE